MDDATKLLWEITNTRLDAVELKLWVVMGGIVSILVRPWAARVWQNGRNRKKEK